MKRIEPTVGITHPSFVYVPAVQTDIRKRFAAAGWTPPSQHRVIPIGTAKAKRPA